MKNNIDVIIFKPSKSAMQSGQRNKCWVLKFLNKSKVELDPLMGWAGSDDTSKQITLKFSSKNQAIEYADDHKLNYRILKNNLKSLKPKSYADNFSYKRKGLWSH